MDEISYVNLNGTLYGMGISDETLEQAKADLNDAARPVGSIYMSTESTDPSELFGGTWESITDTFLLTAGSTYTAGDTGGAATVTLTTSQLPSHTHTITAKGSVSSTFTGTAQSHSHTYTFYGASAASSTGSGGCGLYGSSSNATSGTTNSTSITPKGTVSSTFTGTSGTTSSTGSGGAHNNMPPYLVVYMWQRTA